MTFTFAPALGLLLLIPVAAYIGFPRYGYRRTRDLTSLILRLIVLTLMILAISGAQVVRSADKLAVVFLVDVSDSIDAATQQEQFDYVAEAMESMGINDSAGIVLFGSNAVVERQVNNVRELGEIQSAPITSNTDLAEAIRLGLALFPSDAARRMVILSDGRPTVGDTEAAAGLAAAADVQVDYVLFSPERVPEVQVTDVDVPTTVNAEQLFDLNVTVEAEEATPAEITVYASGEIIFQDDIELNAGQNRRTFTLQAGDSGFRDFRVLIEPQGTDGFYQNNQLSAFSRVVGPPRVLLLTTDPQEALYIVPALEEAGLTVDVRSPNELPVGLVALAQYDSIIMTNVPARFMSPARMDTIKSYVRDLGGGLVFIGGPESYGPGGYFQTPIEEALPLETRIRDQQRLPQLTIAYLVDTSGSMGAVGPSGVQNIELAKEAIIRSIEFLQPTDRAGAANFDTAGSWIADVQPVNDRRALQSLIATLRAGGGTDILAGMRLVARTLVEDPSDRKHIILLTDGGADPSGLIELTGQINEDAEVTTSVIAIGAGSASFLDDMAAAGDGNFYMVDSIDQIPTIFTQETVLATRSYIQEEQFFPGVALRSPIVTGIDSTPPLYGYVATTPKATAQVIWTVPQFLGEDGTPAGGFNDPLLASWQYGLGRSVAFTSDATSRWAADWVDWGNFSTFWTQAVEWTITESASNNVEMRVVTEGEQARVIVDARSDDGSFLNGMTLDMSLVNPELENAQVELQQVAPGRYEASFMPGEEGAYILRLAGGDGETAVNQTTGWVMSYSPEYDLRVSPAGAGILGDVATIAGGREIAEDPALAFEHTLRAQRASSPIWMPLLIAAVLLLPLDIAVRRLVVTRRDLQRAWDAVFGVAANATQETSERMSSLFTARERAREQMGGQPAARSGADTVSALHRNRDDAGTAAPTASTSTPAEEAKPAPSISDEKTSFAALKQRQQQSRANREGTPPARPADTPAQPSKPTTPPASDGGSGNIGSKLLKRRRPPEDEA